jgi:hypothetical protein
MKKKTAAALIGAGAGLALAWLFRGRFAALFDQAAEIVVEPGDGGRPRVTYVTPEVIVKKNKHVRWQLMNHSNVDVLLELKDWQDANNHESAPPAVTADPDDHEQPPQDGLSRVVPATKKRPLRGKARGPRQSEAERVKYAVYLDSQLAVDPIVKLIL